MLGCVNLSTPGTSVTIVDLGGRPIKSLGSMMRDHYSHAHSFSMQQIQQIQQMQQCLCHATDFYTRHCHARVHVHACSCMPVQCQCFQRLRSTSDPEYQHNTPSYHSSQQFQTPTLQLLPYISLFPPSHIHLLNSPLPPSNAQFKASAPPLPPPHTPLPLFPQTLLRHHHHDPAPTSYSDSD